MIIDILWMIIYQVWTGLESLCNWDYLSNYWDISSTAAAVNIVTESFLTVSCLQYVVELSQGQPQGDSDPNIEHHKYKGPPPVTSS